MLLIDILLFTAIVLLTGVLYPVMGYRQTKRRGKTPAVRDKSKWYLSSIISSWIPVIVITVVLILNGHSFKDIGFVFDLPEERGAIFYIISALSAIYLTYNICTILLLRFNKDFRARNSENIPVEYRFILPATKKERAIWRLLAVTAGITEELIYRGYLFFALSLIFPGIHPAAVIAVSSILFSVGHLYQGSEVWKPTAAGLFLSITYYFTGSIYIVIILHIVQDLVAGELDPLPKSNEIGHIPLDCHISYNATISTTVAESTIDQSVSNSPESDKSALTEIKPDNISDSSESTTVETELGKSVSDNQESNESALTEIKPDNISDSSESNTVETELDKSVSDNQESNESALTETKPDNISDSFESTTIETELDKSGSTENESNKLESIETESDECVLIETGSGQFELIENESGKSESDEAKSNKFEITDSI